MENDDFVFTTDNLLENIDKLGGWSCYGLASWALSYYFPELYNDETDEHPEVAKEVELLESLGCEYWVDLIKKYQKEVGYDPKEGIFDRGAVNAY